jgi:hypothetical protein
MFDSGVAEGAEDILFTFGEMRPAVEVRRNNDRITEPWLFQTSGQKVKIPTLFRTERERSVGQPQFFSLVARMPTALGFAYAGQPKAAVPTFFLSCYRLRTRRGRLVGVRGLGSWAL